MTRLDIVLNTGLDIFVIGTSSLLRHSSFVIRHSSHVGIGR
jgi:hypothetical protein